MNITLQLLDKLATRYESEGRRSCANIAHHMFMRLAEKKSKDNQEAIEENPTTTFGEALETLKGTSIDTKGDRSDESIIDAEEYLESLPKDLRDSDAVIDSHHIVVFTPDSGLQVYDIIHTKESDCGCGCDH